MTFGEMMNKIGFSGTLDPLTNGHIWVIEEARRMADNVEIYVSQAPGKKTMFDIKTRRELIEEYVDSRGWDNVTVHIVLNKFIARFAKNRGVDYLIRGIRNSVDFEYEDLIQEVNSNMLHGCKTLFVIPPANAGAEGVNLGAVSSSFVKGLIGNVGWHWEVKKLLPSTHYKQIVEDFLKREWSESWLVGDVNKGMGQGVNDSWFHEVMDQHSMPNRHYHNLEHLVHGMTEINAWAINTNANSTEVMTVKQAFWFHDYVYGKETATASDEKQSAEAFLNSKLSNGSMGNAAYRLILATSHFEQANIDEPLKDVMLGVDLAILGQDWDVYCEYASKVRKENLNKYTLAEYNIGRVKALYHLLARANDNILYEDPYFNAEYALTAIDNLRREINDIETQLDDPN
jgi:pantetheine-phosphate adenylyltransferase